MTQESHSEESTRKAYRPAPATGDCEWISPLVRRLIAPNPGPMTFTGTCVYFIGRGRVALIDPGPSNPEHIERILDILGADELSHIFVTHTHRDHCGAAASLAQRTGARIFGAAPYRPCEATDPRLAAAHDAAYMPNRIMNHDETEALDGFSLTALATPGHANNHLCFNLREENSLFSGDHVMAWSTSVIAPPDGDMTAYMASLEMLRTRSESIYWPGHGGPVIDPQRYLRAMILHRRQREEAILARLMAGDETIPAIVERIYEKLNPNLRIAAALSVQAHLEDLMRRGRVTAQGPSSLAACYCLRETENSGAESI